MWHKVLVCLTRPIIIWPFPNQAEELDFKPNPTRSELKCQHDLPKGYINRPVRYAQNTRNFFFIHTSINVSVHYVVVMGWLVRQHYSRLRKSFAEKKRGVCFFVFPNCLQVWYRKRRAKGVLMSYTDSAAPDQTVQPPQSYTRATLPVNP